MFDQVLQFVKDQFIEPNGGEMKWGSVATTAAGGAAGYYLGGGVGAAAGVVGGTVLGRVLDGVFTKLGLNPIRPMPAYPKDVKALQPTVDLPAPVKLLDQTVAAHVVRSPLLENLKVPTATLPDTQKVRAEISTILKTQAGVERIAGLQRDLQDNETKILQFNLTFDEYLRQREDYHRQGGKREKLVDDVAGATKTLASPMDRTLAEAFVPSLPALGTDIRGESLGDARNDGFKARVDANCTALYHVERAKRNRGEAHRIFSFEQIRSAGHPKTGDTYFVEISNDMVCTFKPSTYDVAEAHKPLMTLKPAVETFGRSVFLTDPKNTADQWNAKTTHEKLNITMTYIEAQRGRYERGDLAINWSALPTPANAPGVWGSAWRLVSTGDTPNFHNSTEEECMASIRSMMVPSNGGVPYPGMHSNIRHSTIRARTLATTRGDTAAVAEYEKIIRYADVLEQHSQALSGMQLLNVVNKWRGGFRDAKLVPAEADAHDFVQHRLPLFNDTKIALMSHGQKTPEGIGRGHFLTFSDCNQAGAETMTAFCTRQPDGSYQMTHVWKGEFAEAKWPEAKLATPLTIDRASIDALETRDGHANNALIANAIRSAVTAKSAAKTATPEKPVAKVASNDNGLMDVLKLAGSFSASLPVQSADQNSIAAPLAHLSTPPAKPVFMAA